MDKISSVLLATDLRSSTSELRMGNSSRRKIIRALNLPNSPADQGDHGGGSGIVVLSATMRLLHANRQGLEWAKKINASKHGGNLGRSAQGILPAVLVELCTEIIKALHVRTEQKDWEQFEIKRVIGDSDQPITLIGFGLPDRRGAQHTKLVITIDEFRQGNNLNADYARERFQLTNRQHATLKNLVMGWTNKEIASALRVTEQTVKEHIKEIMQKMNVTTRMGILMEVLHSQPSLVLREAS